MLQTLSIRFLVAGLSGAGLFNAIGTPATPTSFVRCGYPPWWCRLTGGLEMAGAAPIALPVSREAGSHGKPIIAGQIECYLARTDRVLPTPGRNTA